MWLLLQFLSVTCWAIVNVVDSLLVRHYEKDPLVLMWHLSCFSLLALGSVFFVTYPQTTWMVPLASVGVLAYAGDIVFIKALDRIDVSVTNIAWAILSIFLSLGGFFFFAEYWTAFESVGAVFIIAGLVLLSTWHRSVGDAKALLLLPLLAALYTPFYLVQKAALLAGQPFFPVFFWPILSREVLSFVVPLLSRRHRTMLLNAFADRTPRFFLLCFLSVVFFTCALFLTVKAYASQGNVSLVSIVSNIQPFLVLVFAWILWKIAPRFASKELFTGQSVFIKLVSFSLVFGGLAFLALAQ